MKILFFGDIVGKIGRAAIKQILPELKKELAPDLIMANVENLAHGKGITAETLTEMRNAGIQVFTSGNHIFKKGGFNEILTSNDWQLLRPANYPANTPGRGYLIIKVKDRPVAVINLMGRVFFREALDDPFRKLDEILVDLKSEISNLKLVIVDWHAEASSEKVALGWYGDGRVSAVIGTHTHVPTADSRVLPGGTGFISDVGMVGSRDGILGVERDGPLQKFITQMPQKFEIPETGAVQLNSVYLELDEITGKTVKIARVDREIEITS